MKISIIYHTETGNTQTISGFISEGAKLGGKVNVKVMRIDDVDAAFVEDSKAIILGCPTHRGGLPWQMKKWIGTTKLKLSGKLGSVFATASYIGGGAEIAEMELIAHLLVMGLLVYSSGISLGQPFIHFGAVAIKDGDEAHRERARIFGERIARKAVELFEREGQSDVSPACSEGKE
jgi:NAD(P)H dehydrogenase (quinone)